MTAPHAPTHDEALEAAIQARGRALLAGVKPEHLFVLTPDWWQARLMEWATADPEFRTRLLRFVDVLPALRTPGAVADHVRQYFREDVPGAVKLGSAAAGKPWFRPLLSKVARGGVSSMAGRFIGGATPREALPRLRDLANERTGYTVDLLGEATLANSEADAYQDRYLDLLRVLGRSAGEPVVEGAPRVNISVKLSALTAHFEPAAPEATLADVAPRLLPILDAARLTGAFVNIDMEQFRYKELIHAIFADILLRPELRGWPDVGIVVQAYLKDSLDDIARLEALARERGAAITVRLVKGAYWDEEVIVARQEHWPVPVWEDKAATDLHFERCTQRLVEAYPHLRPAFASHNPRSIAQAMVRSEEAGLLGPHVEFQLLYGMAEGLRRAVRDQGYRTRVYVPVGEILPGMAYLVRRLLENTSNQSWLVNKHEEADPEEALAPPEPAPLPPYEPPGFRNHPPAELHRPEVRAAMLSAIEGARARFGEEVGPIISGERVAGASRDEVRPPADPEQVMGIVQQADAAQAEAAVRAARAGFPGWRDTPAALRAAILRRAADLVAERRYELAAVEVFECAKPWREADGDICEAIDFLRYYAAEAERLAEGIDLTSVPGETNHYLYEPRGVVAVIAPWNFPLAIICGMTSAALAAGCTAVLKPAEQSPLIASRFVAILHEAGVPVDAVHYLPGPGEVIGKALVEHPEVDMIAFTGSNAVGLGIVEAAAKVQPGARGIKKVIAELGGKNAVIVDDDADLDEAVAGVVRSAFGYAGQKCSAASRVIVVGAAYAPFRARLAATVASLRAGPPEDPNTVVPPVISREAQEKTLDYIAIGEREGRLVAKGLAPASGHAVAPYVFEDVPRDSALTCEEVFGPVLTLYRAETFAEALEMALDSPFALTGGLYSRNPRHIRLAREDFRVGNLYINRSITGSIVSRHPFGGFGMSGTDDKAGGPDYVRQFTLARVVTENTVRRGFAPEVES